jgi:hypothetical protein
MSVSTADKIFLCVGLIDFGGMFVWIGIALHLAYTKMDLMLAHLKNCPAVMIRAPFKNGGPSGRLFVQGAIMGLMTTPRLYLRDCSGQLIPDTTLSFSSARAGAIPPLN